MKMRKILLSAAGLSLLTLAGSVAAADIKRGQALHDSYCLNCHDPSVYTRTDRRIDSLEALVRQVQRCETAMGISWPAEDVTDVVHYLNEAYYKFK